MDAAAAIFLTSVTAPADPARAVAERKAEDFEAMVLSQLLAPMFDTAKSPSLFGGDGPEQDTFRSMLNDEYARLLAARGGVGIADSVKDALIEMQGADHIFKGTRT